MVACDEDDDAGGLDENERQYVDARDLFLEAAIWQRNFDAHRESTNRDVGIVIVLADYGLLPI